MSPRSFYSTVDLGGGLRGINSADPVNPQDAATKFYTDSRVPTVPRPAGGAFWELPCQTQAVTNSYGGAYANGGGNLTGFGPNAGLPPNVTITKLYASTRIRVKAYNVSSYATTAVGWQYWGAAINGGAIQQVTMMYFNRTGIRMAAPFGVADFVPGSYSQVNTTGPMNVLWYVATNGCTWNVDTHDSFYGAIGLISELP
jgi:hypothetical protein